MLKQLSEMIFSNSMYTPNYKNPKVYVNVYPYVLEPSEIELIKKAVQIEVGKVAVVEIINRAPHNITPNYLLTKGIDIVIIYDYNEWLEPNTTAFKNKPCVGKTLIAPSLYKTYPIDTNETRKFKDEGFGDVFNFIRLTCLPVIDIKFYPVAYFCNYELSERFIIKEEGRRSSL
jgi:hypothetical protein